MSEHEEIDVKLGELTRDPILPPRILDPQASEALRQSLEAVGATQPIVIRTAPASASGGAPYYIVDGYRRVLEARRLRWNSLRAILRDDLADEDVLLLAYRADDLAQPRPPLEKAWYYARLRESGALQREIAEGEGVSTGKVSMYVNVGETLTPERIRAAGVDLPRAAAVGITHLSEIAKQPAERVSGLLRVAAGVDEPEQSDENAPANFAWRLSTSGTWRARGQGSELSDWSSAERRKLIDTMGPLVDTARTMEAIDSPREAHLRERILVRWRRERLATLEQHLIEVSNLNQRIADLSLALTRSPGGGRGLRALYSIARQASAAQGEDVIRRPLGGLAGVILNTLRHVWRRVSRGPWFSHSTPEPASSTVDEQLAIEFGESRSEEAA